MIISFWFYFPTCIIWASVFCGIFVHINVVGCNLWQNSDVSPGQDLGFFLNTDDITMVSSFCHHRLFLS